MNKNLLKAIEQSNLTKEKIASVEQAAKRINEFLISNKAESELLFAYGYFIKLKKHIRKNEQFLEIHTSGYDDTLPACEAIEWLKWELLDRKANGVFEI